MKQLISKSFIIYLFFSGLNLSAWAQKMPIAQDIGYISCNNNTGYCSLNGMVAISQTDNQLSDLWPDPNNFTTSMLCIPTAASMAALTVRKRAKTIKSLSNIHSSRRFLYTIPLSMPTSVVREMVDYMGTSITTGTNGNGTNKFLDFRNDYEKLYYWWWTGSSAYKYNYYNNITEKSLVPIISHGHYKKKRHTFHGLYTYYTYYRNGGHGVAVYAVKKDTSSYKSSRLHIYNPYNQNHYFSKLKKKSRTDTDIFPYQNSVYLMEKKHDDYYPIIDRVLSFRGY